ncbi:hypothetical protein AB8U03_09710 [Clostridium sp. Mt-5]|uniref:Uncharacterized protein n=1 Tax=Clostridium moutaii TaxID=3240932 RepID=A0ABV4BNX1_9CLOT
MCLIAGKTLNGIKQTCFNIIAAIKNKESIENIEKIINEKLKKDNIIGIAMEKLNGEVYFENWIKPILLLVEYKQNDSNSEGITSFRITQKIVDDYNLDKYQKFWNVQSIIDRHDWLINEIKEISVTGSDPITFFGNKL